MSRRCNAVELLGERTRAAADIEVQHVAELKVEGPDQVGPLRGGRCSAPASWTLVVERSICLPTFSVSVELRQSQARTTNCGLASRMERLQETHRDRVAAAARAWTCGTIVPARALRLPGWAMPSWVTFERHVRSCVTSLHSRILLHHTRGSVDCPTYRRVHCRRSICPSTAVTKLRDARAFNNRRKRHNVVFLVWRCW